MHTVITAMFQIADIVGVILNFLPDIRVLAVNKFLTSAIHTHPEYKFWMSYIRDDVYRKGLPKMLELIKPDFRKIIKASKCGNIAIVRCLIRTRGCECIPLPRKRAYDMSNRYKSNRDTDMIRHAFDLAVEHRHIKVIHYLLKFVENINWAAALACYKGYLDIVKLLVIAGANLTAMDNYALTRASGAGHLEVVRYILTIEPSAIVMADNALHAALNHNHLDVAQYLIDVVPNIASNDHAMIWACYNGHLCIVKRLVELGANIITHGKRAFYWAHTNGHHAVAEYLVGVGADTAIDESIWGIVGQND